MPSTCPSFALPLSSGPYAPRTLLRRGRLGSGSQGDCSPPAPTEPYLCCSHTALRDDGLSPPVAGRVTASQFPVAAQAVPGRGCSPRVS